MSESVVIGVDPSSKTMHSITTVGQGTPSADYQPLHKSDKPRACAETYLWMQQMVYNQPLSADVYVFIEVPVMGRAGAHTMLVIAQVVGAAAAAATNAGAKVTFTNNQRWKKEVIGKGNCGKPEIKAWCKQYWPAAYELADGVQDLYDAAAINRYGQHVVGLSRKKVPVRRVIRRSK